MRNENRVLENRHSKKIVTQVVMLGLDAAGKTTILYKLHIGEVLSTVPTIGWFFFWFYYRHIYGLH